MKTALLISPDSESRNSLGAILQSKFAVVEFDNYDMDFSFLTHSTVDLIIIEDSIQWKQLRSLFYILKNLNLDIPVIVSTSQRSVQTVVKYMKLGVSEVIFKPYDAVLLLKIVESLLNQYSLPEKSTSRKNNTLMPVHSYGDSQNLNPNYIYKMNVKKYLQSVTAELKGRVLNSEITFDEALILYEDKLKQAYAV